MIELEKIFAGQIFEHITAAHILHFHIHAPYTGAGKRWGWEGKGLGINKEALDYAVRNDLTLRVIVGLNPKTAYLIHSKCWRAFCEFHGSIMKSRSTVLYVIQWSDHLFRTQKYREP